jgi:hypothetical protein
MKFMKRICFLIAWLVTGFAIALNTGSPESAASIPVESFVPVFSAEQEDPAEEEDKIPVKVKEGPYISVCVAFH